MFKRVFKFLRFVKYYLEDSESIILRLMEDRAKQALKDCTTLEISDIEELENLVFHIKTYYDIPRAVKETKFPNVKDLDLKKLVEGNIEDLNETEEFMEYMSEVELQRTIERDFIFEHAKALPFGFQVNN